MFARVVLFDKPCNVYLGELQQLTTWINLIWGVACMVTSLELSQTMMECPTLACSAGNDTPSVEIGVLEKCNNWWNYHLLMIKSSKHSQ
jgi:hypothetical protein